MKRNETLNPSFEWTEGKSGIPMSWGSFLHPPTTLCFLFGKVFKLYARTVCKQHLRDAFIGKRNSSLLRHVPRSGFQDGINSTQFNLSCGRVLQCLAQIRVRPSIHSSCIWKVVNYIRKGIDVFTLSLNQVKCSKWLQSSTPDDDRMDRTGQDSSWID